MSNKRILGISIVISVLLIAYKYFGSSTPLLGSPYVPSQKFNEGYNKLVAEGKNQDLVQPWGGLDSIPDGEEVREAIELGDSVIEVTTGNRYEKGSWGDIAQWMRLSFNYDDAYDNLHRKVFGWYKGVNIQPTGFNIYIYKFEIDRYLNSSAVDDVDNIEPGQFIT